MKQIFFFKMVDNKTVGDKLTLESDNGQKFVITIPEIEPKDKRVSYIRIEVEDK